MPYAKRRTAYKRPYRRRTQNVPKPIKSYVNRQITRAENKESPLLWYDYQFTGDSVSTSSSAYSLVKNFIEQVALNSVSSWPMRTYTNNTKYFETTVKIEYIHWQLRYQNDTTDLHSTIRHMIYATSQDCRAGVATSKVLSPGDVDSPPNTADLTRAYTDNIRYLKDQQADEDSEAPGTAILKGSRRIGRNFKVVVSDINDPTGSFYTEEGDLIYENISNSSVAPHPSVYGYIRVYGRVML